MQSPDGTEGSKRKENVSPNVIDCGSVFKSDITRLEAKTPFCS